MKYAFALVIVLATQLSFAAPPSAFKLYPDSHHKVNPSCDAFTLLELIQDTSGDLIFRLSDHVGGVCEMYVDPTPRLYKAGPPLNDCGSKLYSAIEPGNNGTLRLRDNRTRTCQDIIPALFEANEVGAGGRSSPLYSLDR